MNINSQDYSRNVVGQHGVFGDLSAEIERSVIPNPEKTRLRELVEHMERDAGDRGKYLGSYQAFIAAAANHMTIVSPFIPALTQMLT